MTPSVGVEDSKVMSSSTARVLSIQCVSSSRAGWGISAFENQEATSPLSTVSAPVWSPAPQTSQG
eukprot:3416398-Pyramimonas_sp.AAC.1